MQLDSLAATKSSMTKRLMVAASYSLAASVSVLPTMANGGFAPLPPGIPSFSHTPGQSSGWLHPAVVSGAPKDLQAASTAGTIYSNHLPSMPKLHGSPQISGTVGAADINLASTQSNILASNLAGFHNLTIVVGGVKQTVSLSSHLTGAEAVAAQEILDGGSQTIKIAANGQATGGTILLNSSLFSGLENSVGGSIASLTVASGVKIVDAVGLLQLSGSLDNYGSILTASGSLHATDTISASSILNAAGGSISTYAGGAGLYGANALLSGQSSISNSGTISSTGNLTITAPALSNISSASSGAIAIVSARQDLTINTANLINAGRVTSLSSDVNIASTIGALNVTNNGGSINALAGDINITANNANINVSGGNLLSNQVSIKASTGEVNLSAQNVSGVINASGDSVHITTTSSQNLGDIDTSGDPQFVSTAGNITINGTITPTDGASLAIIAGGNIVSTSTGQLNTSALTSGDGGNLTLIAGANVTGNDTAATVTDSLNAGRGSTTGGIIDLSGGNGGHGALSAISTAGSGTAGNGGNVEMIAYAGTAAGSGTIKLPSSLTINASGSGTGTPGDVVLIAGASKGTAITTGNITANQLSISTGTPTANAGNQAGVVFTDGTSNLGISAFTAKPESSASSATIATGKLTASDIALTSGDGAGTAGKPIIVNASQLSIVAVDSRSSAYVTDESSTGLILSTVSLGSSGIFSLTVPTTTSVTDGLLNIDGPVAAGTVKITETVANAEISYTSTITANTTTLTTPGDIIASSAGLIVGGSATLSGAALTIATNVSNLNATTYSGGATITQGATPLTLNARVASDPGNNLIIDSLNQIDLKNQITLTHGIVTLADLGFAGGIKLGAAVNAATVNLTAGSAGISSSGTIKAGIINLTSAGNIGSSSRLLRVNNDLALGQGNSLTIISGTGTSAYIQDLGKTDLSLDAASVNTGNVLDFISAASALNLVEAPFNTISIKDTNSLGSVTLNSNALNNAIIGTGLGRFTLTTNGDIAMNASTSGVRATSVSLITEKGSIAQTGDLVLNTPSVSFQARKGNVSMTDLASGNIAVTGTTTEAFYFISSGNNANLSINSPIKSTNILLTAEGTNSNITVNDALGAGATDQGNFITITPTGNLTINGALTADYMILGGNTYTGDPILLGTVNINKPLIVDHSINMFVNQSSGININAPVTANAMRFVTANAGADIVLNASLIAVKDAEGDGTIVTVQADNANIVSKNGVTVGGAYLSLTGNNIGTAAAPLATTSNYTNLAVGGGSAYINNNGNLTLATVSPITAGTINLKTTGWLSFDGSISAQYLTVSATGQVTVGQQFESPLSSLVGLANLTINAGGGLLDYASLGGPNITVNTPVLTLSGINLVASGNLTVSNTAGSLAVDGSFSANNVTLNSSAALSIGASTDNGPGDITAANQLTLSASSINNYATVSGATVLASTATFANKTSNTTAGTLSSSDSLSFINTTGSLTLTGAANSITTAIGGSLSLLAQGSITISSADPLAGVALGQLHSLAINAGGIFTGPFSAFTVAPDLQGNGGIIDIKASNIAYNGPLIPPAAFDLNASGSTATGGQITLNLTKATGGVVIGAGVNDYNINASGINGGTVLISSSSSNLTVDANYLDVSPSSGGAGSNISLLAGGNLLIKGNIDTHTGTGTYGNVVLQSNASTTFVIGGTSTTTNGIVGLSAGTAEGVLGNSVTIINKSGVDVNPGFLVSAQSSGITFDTTTLINNGQVDTPGTLTITNGGNITLPAGTSGTFLPSMSGIAIISTNGNITLLSALPVVSDLQLSATKGTLSLVPGTSSFTAVTAAGDGGRIDIAAKTIKGTITALDAAAATTTGAGGTISLTLTGTTALNIGSGMSFDLSKGILSNQGGSLTISNGGNLTVDASALTLGQSLAGTAGANLTLQAGSISAGALLVTNAAQFADQIVNNLSLLSNSSQSFSLGGASSKGNGLADSQLSLSAQTITIQNTGGGILSGSSSTLTANSSSISPALILVAGKGDIGAPTTPLSLASASLFISAAGSAYLNNATASTLTSITTGNTFSYTSSAAITATGNVVAPNLILNVASVNQSLQANQTSNVSIVTASGSASISDIQSTTVTVNNFTAPGGVTLTTGGAIVIAPSAIVIGDSIALTAGGVSGGIELNAPVASSGSVSISASGKGKITESGQVNTISGSSITLLSQNGSIGASSAKLLFLDTANLNVTSNANAFIQNAYFAPTISASLTGTLSYSGNIGGSSASILAPALALSLGTNSAVLNTNASSIAASTTFGNLVISDSQTANVALGILNAPSGQVNVTSAGPISVNGAINSASGVSLTAGGINGAITVTKAINAPASTLTLQSSGAGALINGGGILSANSLVLVTQGANIGSANKALASSVNNISVTTGLSGNVYLSNTDSQSNGVISLTAAQVGSLKITDTNTSSKNSGSLIAGDVSAGSGQIFITSNEQSLYVSAGSNINTLNGNITLQNKYAANSVASPLISIGNNSTIHASADPASNLNAGNVLVVLGAIPASLSLSAGVTPSGAPTINISGSGSVTFGTTSNASGSITAASTDTLNGLNRSLAFSTGQNASSQIILGNNVTITADPPQSAATTSASALTAAIEPQQLNQAATQSFLNNQNQATGQIVQTLSGKNLPSQSPYYLPPPLQMNSQGRNTDQIMEGEAVQLPRQKLHGAVTKSNNKHDQRLEVLNSGANLFAPVQQTLVETPFATVRLARGAVALIIVSTNGLSVYNLHDSQNGAVAIHRRMDKQSIYLRPGSNATLTADEIKTFEQINATDKIAYRRINSQTLENGERLFRSEFELLSMLRCIKPLSDMVSSNDSAMHNTVVNVIKTAAILSQLNTGEPYTYLAAPDLTAVAANH